MSFFNLKIIITSVEIYEKNFIQKSKAEQIRPCLVKGAKCTLWFLLSHQWCYWSKPMIERFVYYSLLSLVYGIGRTLLSLAM